MQEERQKNQHLILKTKFPSFIIASQNNVDKLIKQFTLKGHYEWIRMQKDTILQ